MKNKTKVLFLIPSLVGGGAERTLINILKNIDYALFEVHLVVIDFNGVYCKQVPKEVKVISMFSNTKLVRGLSYIQKKFGFNYFFEQRFVKKIDSEYKTAISFLDSNFTNLLFKIPKVKKTISWVHSSYKTNQNFYKFYKNESYKNQLKANRYSKLDTIAFVSDDAKTEFIEIFGAYKNMPVVYNFMDENNILKKAGNSVFHNDDGIIKFVSVGSLYPVKGYYLLIDAAARLKSETQNFKIDIYGSGYLENELLEQIKINELEGFVELKGFTSNPYLAIKNADVFLMTSKSEAMPMALCEAMILGKPVLVTNCSGCREVVNYGEYGLMADQNSIDFCNKLKLIINDKNLREDMSSKSLNRAKIFSDEHIMSQIISIIN